MAGGTFGLRRSACEGSSMYVSNFDDWYERASVRVKPRRMLLDEEAAGRVYFPSAQLPIVDHPLVRERGAAAVRTLQIRHLYRYLDFTTHLEHHLVNSAAQKIAFKRTDFDLPDAMLFDAHKLYTDEAYHALFSEDLKIQVVAATQVLPGTTGAPGFLKWLHGQQAAHPPEWEGLLEIYSAVVAETLISATLVQVPRDPTVVTAVRDLIADHAEDEAIHHKFFAQLFRMTWPKLSAEQRSFLGPKLAQFMIKFLFPDFAELRANLRTVGLDEAAAEEVLEQTYASRDEVMAGIRRTARMTLRLFEQCGVLRDAEAQEAFEREGLLVPTPAATLEEEMAEGLAYAESVER